MLNNYCVSVMVNVDLRSSAFDNSWGYAAKNDVALTKGYRKTGA